MSQTVNLGSSDHCCVCNRVCHHVGGPWLCDEHKATSRVAPPYVPPVVIPLRPERAGIGDRPCPASTEAVLGFPEPTRIPCGLVEGHAGKHSYSIEWGGAS